MSLPSFDYIYFPPLNSESVKPQCVYHSVGLPDNVHYIHVSVDYEQAQAGRGAHRERRYLKPYTPELWQACETFMEWKRVQLEAINEAYRNLPHQMNLL